MNTEDMRMREDGLMVELRARRIVRYLSWTLVTLALLPMAYVLIELVGRLALFFASGAVAYQNHVAPEYFQELPEQAMVAALWSVGGFLVASATRCRRLAWVALAFALVGFLTPRILEFYHDHAILVTYEEFCDHGC